MSPYTVCHTGVAFTAMAANTGYVRYAVCSNDCQPILIIEMHVAEELPSVY